ncbi:hypothetical protein H5P30_17480 [Puniceicoccus vermicola]|uniref:Uncharacterized protein n=2 Tax=Puniceicoccus vermicola TaxID=388746 RepID=A0A7X1E5W6_9BACT|nr:hypothetical protein [Puniceicoccus vermicola]
MSVFSLNVNTCDCYGAQLGEHEGWPIAKQIKVKVRVEPIEWSRAVSDLVDFLRWYSLSNELLLNWSIRKAE